jgi:phosphonoacetaldehyde hydrolase
MNIDSFEHEKTLTEKELSKRNIQSGNKLHRAGAHFVIDSIADLPAIIDEINNRLKRGIEPNPNRPKRNLPYADLPDLKI